MNIFVHNSQINKIFFFRPTDSPLKPMGRVTANQHFFIRSALILFDNDLLTKSHSYAHTLDLIQNISELRSKLFSGESHI